MSMEKKTGKVRMKTLLWLWGIILVMSLLLFHNYILGNDTLVFSSGNNAMVFSDIGADTKEQYIMWYNGIVNHLRAGNFSAWDFNDGFGVSSYNMNLFEPFLWIVYLVGWAFGPERIAPFMIFIQIAKILLAGTACYLFLSEYRTNEKAKLCASLMYAFNGYLMVWGQHYALGTIMVLLPFLFLFLEKAVRIRRALFGVAAMSGILILSGYYQAYMALLFTGIYLVLRILVYEMRPVKERLKLFFAQAGALFCGIPLGACCLFPGYFMLSGTTRLSDGRSIFQKIIDYMIPWSRDYYKTVIFRLFGSNLQGAANDFKGYANYYEAACLFFSTLFIVLFLQYLFTLPRQKTALRQKIAQIAGMVICAFIFGIKLGSVIFNGFTYEFSRHTFVLMPLFALISARMLDQIFEEKKLSVAGLIAAVAAIVLVYGRAYQTQDNVNYKTNALMLCLSGLGMAAILFYLWFAAARQRHREKKGMAQAVNAESAAAGDSVYASGESAAGYGAAAGKQSPVLLENRERMLCTGLILLLCVNILSDTTLCYRYRVNVKKNDVIYFDQTYHSNVNAALAWLRENDKELFRTEKDFRSAGFYLDSQAQNYRGVSTYNAMQNGDINMFVSTLWPQLFTGADTNHYNYMNALQNVEMSALTGVKYLLSFNPELDVPGWNLLHQVGDVYIYENPKTKNIAKFFTRTVTEEKYQSAAENLETWDFVTQVLVTEGNTAYELSGDELKNYSEAACKDVVDLNALDKSVYQVNENGIYEQGEQSIDLPINKAALKGMRNLIAEFTVTSDMQTLISVKVDDYCISDLNCYEELNYRIYIPEDTETLSVIFADKRAAGGIENLRFYQDNTDLSFSDDAEILISAPNRDSRVSGFVSAKTDGMVMAAIPYQKGWTLTVDGQKVTPVRADFGFMAFEVKAGDHDFIFDFAAPGAWLGNRMSIISWILWALLLIVVEIMMLIRRIKQKKAARAGADGAGSTEDAGAEAEYAAAAAGSPEMTGAGMAGAAAGIPEGAEAEAAGAGSDAENAGTSEGAGAEMAGADAEAAGSPEDAGTEMAGTTAGAGGWEVEGAADPAAAPEIRPAESAETAESEKAAESTEEGKEELFKEPGPIELNFGEENED